MSMLNITLPSVTPSSIVQPVVSSFMTGLGPIQGAVNSTAGLGGSIQDMLGLTSSTVGGFVSNPGASFLPTLNINLANFQGSLGNVLSVTPPTAIGQVSNIVQSGKNIGTNATAAFNQATSYVSSTKGIVTLGLIAVCMMFSSVIQKFMSELIASALRMERYILAQIDKVKKAIMKEIRRALDTILKALPDCTQLTEKLKKIAKQFQSILGKMSTIVAKVNDFMRKVSECAAIADGTLSLVDGISSGSIKATLANSVPGIGLTGVVTKSKELAQSDMVTMKSEFASGLSDTINKFEENRSWYDDTGLLWNETTGRLEEAGKVANDIKNQLSGLLEDSKNHPEYNPEYPKRLEETLGWIEKVKESLEEAKNGKDNEKGLYDQTKNTIDEITDTAIKGLDELGEELDKKTDEIGKTVDDIFQNLEEIAQEFDTPEFQEQLITACMDTEVRITVE